MAVQPGSGGGWSYSASQQLRKASREWTRSETTMRGPRSLGFLTWRWGGSWGGQLQTLQTVLYYLTSLLPSNSIFLTNGYNQNWDVGFHEVLSKGERG